MFNFIKSSLGDIYTHVTSKIVSLLSGKTIDDQTLQELEVLLLSADTGVRTTRHIITLLKAKAQEFPDTDSSVLLANILISLLLPPPQNMLSTKIHLLVGINGSGKTTCAAKLAHFYQKQCKSILFIAADTFRAAAADQLAWWASTRSAAIETGRPGQDPASIVFKGCQRAIDERFDIIIIDTAGRLQTKAYLMDELAKIKRVAHKVFPGEPINTLLTIDSMLGQNSLEQARIFKETTNVSGIILTKMDGTAKGGIVFTIAQELGIPVSFITYGEQPEDMKVFDPKTYVHELLATTS